MFSSSWLEEHLGISDLPYFGDLVVYLHMRSTTTGHSQNSLRPGPCYFFQIWSQMSC